MVQTNTVQGPGGEAGVMRIKGTGNTEQGSAERGLAMALDGNGRWCYLDPKLGAMHAVAEAARKVACTGATPVAATNCLNFGNPEKPEIMAQLSAAIDGIAEACTALGTPITGGNVSLYNETRGEGIYPTPVLGIVGILEDVTKAVPAHFQREKDAIVLLWPIPRGEEPDPNLKVPLNPSPISQYPLPALEREPRVRERRTRPTPKPLQIWPHSARLNLPRSFSAALWGTPPALDLDAEAEPAQSARRPCRGANSSAPRATSPTAALLLLWRRPHSPKASAPPSSRTHRYWLIRSSASLPSPLPRSSSPPIHSDLSEIDAMADQYNFLSARIGTTGGNRLEISVDGDTFISAPLAELRTLWASALEANLHDEVPA